MWAHTGAVVVHAARPPYRMALTTWQCALVRCTSGAAKLLPVTNGLRDQPCRLPSNGLVQPAPHWPTGAPLASSSDGFDGPLVRSKRRVAPDAIPLGRAMYRAPYRTHASSPSPPPPPPSLASPRLPLSSSIACHHAACPCRTRRPLHSSPPFPQLPQPPSHHCPLVSLGCGFPASAPPPSRLSLIHI